ncbi:MAG: hypothetical protein ACI81R_000493 [Bradymonadia bacterium]|jgi:hypothetical protein
MLTRRHHRLNARHDTDASRVALHVCVALALLLVPKDALAQEELREVEQSQRAETTVDEQTFLGALRFAENSFVYGDFDDVVGTLEPVVFPPPPSVEDDRLVRAYTLLGVSAHFEDDGSVSDRAFLELLRIAPDLRLDPLLYPPVVIERFDSVRRDNAAELGDLALPAGELGSAIYVEKEVTTQPLAVSASPFGIGFLASGRTRTGMTYLVSETALTSVMIGMYFGNEYDRNRDGSFSNPQVARRRGLVQRVSAGALVAVVTTNVLHGVLTHQQAQRVSYRTSTEAPEGLDEPRRRNRLQVRFVPIF